MSKPINIPKKNTEGDEFKSDKNYCDMNHSLKDSCLGKAYNIPISNSDNNAFIKNKFPPIINISNSAPESIGIGKKILLSSNNEETGIIISNYMKMKTNEVLTHKSEALPIVGTSPNLKPNNFAEKSLNSIKNLLNFKL
jgi:hypothetical protein